MTRSNPQAVDPQTVDPQTVDLQTVDPQTIDQVAAILGNAFADYPMFQATLRDDLRRRAAMPLMWRAVARQVAADADSHLDLAERDGKAAGAAIWTGAGGAEVGWLDAVRHGQLRFGLAAGVRDSLALKKLQDRVDQLHREVISEPHVYLLAIGVLDGHQGQGVGSELLARGMARADQVHQPVYLETYLQRNVDLYLRNDFVVVRTDQVNGMTCHSMLRPSR